MSLHLIESRTPARVLVLRRPGANAVSVVMHAALITAAIIATSTPPTFAKVPKPVDSIVYVDPTPPPPPAPSPAPPAQASHPGSTAPTLVTLKFLAPVDIPTIIPEISLDAAPIADAINIVGRQMGSSRGVPGGTPYGTGDGNDVRDQLHVDRAVMLLPGMPLPRYPESLRSAGIQDTLLASFVVDTLGRMEPGSLTFTESPHVAFATSVRDALLRARFKPAEADGHKVRQLVQQPFLFSLSR